MSQTHVDLMKVLSVAGVCLHPDIDDCGEYRSEVAESIIKAIEQGKISGGFFKAGGQ